MPSVRKKPFVDVFVLVFVIAIAIIGVEFAKVSYPAFLHLF